MADPRASAGTPATDPSAAGQCTSDCEAALRELRTFLDSELGADARAAVQAHIDGCLDCLQAFDFHAELRQVIARKCADDVPPDLLAKIRRCLVESGDGSDGSLS